MTVIDQLIWEDVRLPINKVVNMVVLPDVIESVFKNISDKTWLEVSKECEGVVRYTVTVLYKDLCNK